jgi:hypothetical protein
MEASYTISEEKLWREVSKSGKFHIQTRISCRSTWLKTWILCQFVVEEFHVELPKRSSSISSSKGVYRNASYGLMWTGLCYGFKWMKIKILLKGLVKVDTFRTNATISAEQSVEYTGKRIYGYIFEALPGSIPGATRFSEKLWVWNGVRSASWVQLRSCLEEIVAAPVQKSGNTALGIRCADHATVSVRKSWHKFSRQVAVSRSV